MRTIHGTELKGSWAEDIETRVYEVINNKVQENKELIRKQISGLTREGLLPDPGTDVKEHPELHPAEHYYEDIVNHVYENMEFDPREIGAILDVARSHMNRKFDKYIDTYMADMKEEQITKGVLSSLNPNHTSIILRIIARAIENSKQPSISMVASDLRKVLTLIG